MATRSTLETEFITVKGFARPAPRNRGAICLGHSQPELRDPQKDCTSWLRREGSDKCESQPRG